MSQPRNVDAEKIKIINTAPPFSSFNYIEKSFGDYHPIRRLFSQARSEGMQRIIREEIHATGMVADENDELQKLYPKYKMGGLVRLSFWKTAFGIADLSIVDPNDLLGYAILKKDNAPERKINFWHVFEAVSKKNSYKHTYVPAGRGFDLRVGGFPFRIDGVLYCQQNNLNKACAQVALRSLCSMHPSVEEISVSRINELARTVSDFNPSDGLSVKQIRAVLDGLSIGYTDIDYSTMTGEERIGLDYQKFLYAGIESRAGALLGFKLTGPGASGNHIIPFFGHTFNKDTWVPNADSAYFHVGEDTRYIPSESWLASFVGHDDNFGSNFCIPRLYIAPEQAQYVASLRPNGAKFSGVEAEAIAVDMFYSVLRGLVPPLNRWLTRLVEYAQKQKIILRSVHLSKEDYLRHLREMKDWEGRSESPIMFHALEGFLPTDVWMIELSIPELFPANLRKLGEIVLNSTVTPAAGQESDMYVIARLPERYLIFDQMGDDEIPKFITGPSHMQSHTGVFSFAPAG